MNRSPDFAEGAPLHASDERPKASFWRKLGGGSLSISLIVHGIILAIGIVWVVSIIPPPPEKKVDFMPSGGGGGSPAASDVKNKKRSMSLNSNAPRMAAVGAESKFALPEPDTSSEMSSLGSLGGGGLSGGLGGSGSGGGKGSGTGTGFGSGMGPGLDGTGGGITFFNQAIKAQRVAYVIDYSASMQGKRERLMRKELSTSVEALPPLAKFQLIFFSGPAWVAGDKLDQSPDRNSAVVTHGEETYKWEATKDWTGEWKRVGKRQQVQWIEATRANLTTAAARIKSTPLSPGTDWVSPLEMAIAMDPPPDVIFFMTDGLAKNTEMRTIIAKAKVNKTVINTIAMMEPAAGDAMKKLATGTGGKFTTIEADGTVKPGN